MRNIVETRSLLSNTIKDTSTIMHNPLSEYVGRGYMIYICCNFCKSLSNVANQKGNFYFRTYNNIQSGII